MGAFTGSLNANKLRAVIYNMIISQMVFNEGINGYMSLVDRARVDGTMYGDQKLYYSVDALESYPFYPDNKDQLNVLKTHYNNKVKCQSITMNVARQIPTTLESYFSKQAFSESAFADFTSALIKWLVDTKKIYDQTTYNAFIGTNATATGSQTQTVTLPTLPQSPTLEDYEVYNRLSAEEIAEKIANILVEMKDVSRDYNDNQYLRAFDDARFVVVWNAAAYNKILKKDLPSIFHKDGLIDKFDEDKLPARYFGNINTSQGTAGAANKTVRSLYETWYYNNGTNIVEADDTIIKDTTKCPNGVDSIANLTGVVHVFAGDLIPNNAKYAANRTYTESSAVICKIFVDGAVPYMSGFEVSTDFINGRGLSENRYLTFAHNTLEHLKEYPFVTIKTA